MNLVKIILVLICLSLTNCVSKNVISNDKHIRHQSKIKPDFTANPSLR